MKKIAIIGGGLAGTACAYMVRQAGAQAVIYEAGASLAGGASGNALGLYNPRLSAHRTPQSDFYTAGFALALEVFPALGDVGWSRCGALHLMNDEKRAQRFPQTVRNWGWGAARMRLVDAQDASEIAGVALRHEALYLPESGMVSPMKLCHAYARDAEVHLNSRIESPADLDADAVIIANASGARAFAQTAHLPLNTVRGQVTQVRATAASAGLQCALCYSGYFAPAVDGLHMLGATFQRWLDHDDVIEEDDEDNIAKLAAVAPELAEGLEIVGCRAAVRITTPDHFPIVGPAPGHENLYVSAGHGSHGILSTLASAALLADMILGRSPRLGEDVQAALSVARFL